VDGDQQAASARHPPANWGFLLRHKWGVLTG
jgi:hypothetical protein